MSELRDAKHVRAEEQDAELRRGESSKAAFRHFYSELSGHKSRDWSEYVNAVGVISETFTREHESDCVNSAFSLRNKPVNERLKNPAETACEQRKVNGGH